MTREARRNFRLTNLSLDELNFVLGQMADRLDELEGRRGTPKFRSNVDMGMNRVTSMQSGQQASDGATVIQIDQVASEVEGLEGSTSGVGGLVASAVPGANRIVMSPTTGQYIDKGWLSTDLLKYYFESAEQTITSAGSLTIAHGLGVEPKLIQVVLVCKTAEGGYSIGNKVFMNPHLNKAGTLDQGVAVVPDATYLNIRYGAYVAIFSAIRFDTGVSFGFTNANWKAIFRAWA